MDPDRNEEWSMKRADLQWKVVNEKGWPAMKSRE